MPLATGAAAGIFEAMPRAASLTKDDYELLAQFRYTLRKFLGFSERAALAHGVTPQQYQALLAIEGYPGKNWVTVGELAEQMQVAHHSAVGLIDRIESLGLVKRAAAKEDRRRVEVRLTRKGLSVLEKLYRLHRQELQTVGPRIAGLLKRAADEPGRFASPACAMPEIED